MVGGPGLPGLRDGTSQIAALNQPQNSPTVNKNIALNQLNTKICSHKTIYILVKLNRVKLNKSNRIAQCIYLMKIIWIRWKRQVLGVGGTGIVMLRWQHWHIICVSVGAWPYLCPGVSLISDIKHLISLKMWTFMIHISHTNCMQNRSAPAQPVDKNFYLPRYFKSRPIQKRNANLATLGKAQELWELWDERISLVLWWCCLLMRREGFLLLHLTSFLFSPQQLFFSTSMFFFCLFHLVCVYMSKECV